ncbi:MAG: LemA family protein [Tenericutes bacterium ADurb.Bin087]|nr:MAG: LemA family protein [Tenericutes bacterium ADurb.Bin087]
MANELDELTGPVNKEGQDINVISKQLKIKVGWGSTLFEVLLWFPFIIPGVIFLFKKIQAKKHFQQLQQRIQHHASQIDNYLEQRVVILNNVVGLVNRAVALDKDTFTTIAAARSGASLDENRNVVAGQVGDVTNKLNIAFENYPELKAHQAIQDAMQQNSYLQREITAARELYNDVVNRWNSDVYAWPTKMIVAAREGYTTRIPFSTSAEMKAEARKTFF